jgi:hypothetical protein
MSENKSAREETGVLPYRLEALERGFVEFRTETNVKLDNIHKLLNEAAKSMQTSQADTRITLAQQEMKLKALESHIDLAEEKAAEALIKGEENNKSLYRIGVKLGLVLFVAQAVFSLFGGVLVDRLVGKHQNNNPPAVNQSAKP